MKVWLLLEDEEGREHMWVGVFSTEEAAMAAAAQYIRRMPHHADTEVYWPDDNRGELYGWPCRWAYSGHPFYTVAEIELDQITSYQGGPEYVA